MSNISKIVEFLSQHLGVRRNLGEWCDDINKISMRKKYSKRELASVFNRVLVKEFSVEHYTNPIQYAFFPLAS